MSGSVNKFNGSFLGAAALQTIATCPFQPRTIRFWLPGGAWGLKMADEDGMSSDNYISSTAADTGVTITATGFTVANGADVNSVGVRTYYECED